MRKYKQQKKTRFALQGIQIVKRTFFNWLKGIGQIFKVKGGLYVIVLSAILIYMPYAHVKYSPTDIEGIFGFKWMSSFLFALALPSVLIASGLLLNYLTIYLDSVIVPFVKLLSFLTLASGCFFMAWTFYTTPDDFEPSTYYSALIALSFGFLVLTSLIQKAFIYSEEKLKQKIRILFTFIYSLNTTNVIKEEKEEEFAISRIEVTDKVILEKE